MRLFGQSLLDELGQKAATAARGRAHHNVHASAEDLLQRFFVAADTRTYFRPHRHTTKSEMAVILRGGFDVLTFDDDGVVTARYTVGEGSAELAYETPPNTWHMLLSRRDGSAFLEIKLGPYDPAVAAQFADWAPAEGEPSAEAFLAWARRAAPGDRYRG